MKKMVLSRRPATHAAAESRYKQSYFRMAEIFADPALTLDQLDPASIARGIGNRQIEKLTRHPWVFRQGNMSYLLLYHQTVLQRILAE